MRLRGGSGPIGPDPTETLSVRGGLHFPQHDTDEQVPWVRLPGAREGLRVGKPFGRVSSELSFVLMPHRADKSIMRSLGEFCGHVLKGVRTNPETQRPAPARMARERVEEEVRDTPSGRVLVRRTVIEEILVPAATPVDRADVGDDAPRGGTR